MNCQPHSELLQKSAQKHGIKSNENLKNLKCTITDIFILCIFTFINNKHFK